MATGGNNQTLSVTIGANMDPSGVLSAVKQMQSAFSGLKLPGNIGADLEKSFDKAADLLKKYQTQLSKGINTKTDAKNITKTGSQINEVLDEIVTHINSINGQQIFLKADVSGLNTLKTNIENARTAWKNAIQEFRKGSDIEKVLNEIAEKTTRSNLTQGSISSAKTLFDKGDLEGYRNALDDIYNRLKNLKDTTIKNVVENLGLQDAGSKVANLDQIKKRLEDISKIDFSGDSNVDTKFKAITTAVTEYETEVKRASQAGQNAFNNINVNKTVKDTRDLVDATDQYKNSIMSAKDQVQQLQQSTQYFFSLRNMINLLKRGIDEAVQSVKELDKAMTETAVVTDYKVSDLWGMLPEYTKVANQLGATTQGAYETMTLYYQQGLEQQQAFELGAETMKMARIAGLDYAETTDMMTAALRGFNMELNETSAKRVNDVYSELAAITASDTEELGTAMQRTASIAASAGASFEGTTAFLAQAIETTREPAENIGTAMKTIVARFQEMKKNPLEISEVDGEEVDYNKIDAALKTIGVDLKDTNGQFREFDQVMLDISAKWNTLSQSQQRYIATTAAGSRQQSRFIAMVSNYDRTMQLMEAANNSAGASDEQFGKTMDSLESKLNQLHNAWQQFTMGIANNDMIKMAVDGLTGFLNITNKIIDTLSLGSGALKSFLSIFAAFTGLKMAGRGANALIGGLGGLVDPKSSVKEGLKIGLFGQGKNAAQAKAITTPIVGSLSKISGQIAAIAKRQGIKDAGQKGSTAGVKETSKEDYANTKRLFNQLSGKEGFKMGDASNLFGKLDEKHQLSMFNNNPGTKQAMKQASMNWFGGLGLSKGLEKEGKGYISSIYKGMQQGQIPVDKGVELIGKPQKWGQYFGTETAQAYSKSFIKESIPAMEESTQIAHEAAMYSLGLDPNDYKVGSDEIKQLFKDKNNKQLKEDYAALYGDFRKDIEKSTGHEGAKGTVSNLGRFANDIGSIGDKFTQAGYGITTFGNALSQLGGPIGAVGTGIATFGSAISSMGMMVSGATSLITVFSEGIQIAGTSIAISGGAIAAVAAPLAAAAAAFLLVRAHLKKVKEAGEEVTNTFNETNKTAEDNIAKLKSYQNEFATLSKGVDANGNNVNLDDSQYQRYLEIVDDIAAINPDIVEGYNAQGHAIINNNKALEETLKKQQQIKDEAYDTYTSEDSLQKLINARNINNDFKAINVKGETPSVYDGSGHGNEGRQKPIGLGKDVFNIADQLRLNKDFDESSLQKYGINSLDSLINGEEQAVKNFIKHRQQIQADLSNSGLKLNESILNGFDKLGEDATAFDEAIKPVYDNLLANVSNSKVFESIAPEFRTALQTGLKDLASQDLDAPEMAKAANNMAMRFANLTTGSGKYKDALDIVEKAQQDFAATLDETEYKADVQPAIDDLNRLKEKALKEGSAYGDALAEYLENQIERISRFTEEGTISLSEALNTMQDDIAAAEGALSSFQDATKSDYSTAASGMKGIFEEIFKETDGKQLHTEGFGDQTFWKGAKELLSEDVVDTGNIDNVIDKLNKIKPALEDGQDGWENFLDIVENTKGMDKWFKFFDDGTYDINIPEEEFSEVAKQLGVSENFLTSMLNKGRQFANISFSNVDSVRKALATSDSAIKGKTVDANGNKNLYVKEDSIRAELFNQGYVTKEDQDRQLATYFEKGIKTIPAADSKELTADQLKSFANDWGVKNLPDLIQTLNETGEFTKDEIKAYADKLGMLDTEEGFEQDYANIISAAENPELVRQTSELQSINAKVGALLDRRNPEEQTSAWQDFHKMIYGGEGVDTDFQQFARGKDSSGGSLDSGEYETTKKNMQEAIQTAEEASQKYKFMAEQSSGADKAHFEELAQKYDADAQHIKALMAAGEKAYADSQKQIDKERQAAQAKNANRTESQKQQQQAASKAQAKTNAQAANEKGKTQTNTIINNTEENKTVHEKTIYEAEVDPQLEDLNAKYGYDRTTQTIVNYLTKGEEDLQLAEDKISNIDLATQDPKQIMITANTNGISVAEAALKKLPSTKTIGLNLNIGGFTAKISDVLGKLSAVAAKAREAKLGGTAAGHNNSFKTIPVPMFQSAAKGKGHVGPKNRGGLTLTGEEGYEIAWLPSEGRSMILGAAGPQMINLPADAIVYTHAQSEDILKKRQTIDAGSHGGEVTGGGKRRQKNNVTKSSKKSSSKSKKSKKKSKKKDKDKTKPTINNFSIEEVVRFNIDQELTKLTDQIAKRTKDIEKSLDKIGITYNDILGSTKAQIGALESVKNKNQALYNSYQAQLNDYLSRQAIISYTDSKGKSHDQTISIAQYLNADGSANTGAIASAGGREVQEAIYKEINSAKALVDGMNNAQKAIDDANDQIDEFHKKIADTFYNWENQITWVYDLTQRLNNIQSLRDRFSEYINLELDKVTAGFSTVAEALDEVSIAAKRDNRALLDQIAAQREMINARKAEMEDAYSWADEQKELSYQINKNADKGIINQAETNLEAAKLMRTYIKSFQQREDGSITYEIDWERFEQDKRDTKITNTTYDAVYKQLEKLNSSTTEYNNSIKDLTSSVDQFYQDIIEAQQTQVDLEADLLDGLEEQNEEQINSLKDLNSSITDTLKDLLDDVKQKLDERRRNEDNLKTERDISQKQQRLAALRADTSGGHQVEIAQLEKEIAESQQSYQRTLEDQLLDKLTQQADEAARQREHQIELLEASNKINIDNRELVREWVENPTKYQTEIIDILKKQAGYDEAGLLRQEQIDKETQRRIIEGQNATNQLNNNNNNTEKTQQDLLAEQKHQQQLEQEKIEVDNQLIEVQTKLADATAAITAKQNELNNINDNISSTQQQLTRYKSSPSYSAYQKLQEEYAQYLQTYTKGNQNDYNKTGLSRKESQLSFEQFARQNRFKDSIIYSEKYKYNFEQIKALEQKLNELQDQKQTLTDQATTAQQTFAEIQQSVAKLQEESNEWATQIAQSQQAQQDLQSQITNATTNSLMGIRNVVDNQSNIQADVSYLNTNGQTISGTEKLTPEIKAEQDYGIAKEEQAKRTAAEEAERQRQIAAEAERQRVAAAQQAAADYQTQLANVKAIKPSKVTKDNINALYNYGAAAGVGKAQVLRDLVGAGGADPFTWANILKPILDSSGINRWNLVKTFGDSSAATKAVLDYFNITLKNLKKQDGWKTATAFSTGGLANYTGPAWLDGTPSKPELVLNAKDTANFIALKDVLSKAMGSTKSINNSYGGDNIFEININVDKIEKDYDVDRVADRVKKKILESSSYRNVTQVRNFR